MLYEPHNWVILDCGNDIYKVFGTWSGGYLDSDAWKLNSGIVDVTVTDDGFFEFLGYSGSVYKCHPDNYGTPGIWLADVLQKILELGASVIPQEQVTIDFFREKGLEVPRANL